MYVIDEKKQKKFEKELIEFFEENKTFENPLEALTEALAYLTSVTLRNIPSHRDGCNMLATSIMLGFARQSFFLASEDRTDDVAERVNDYMREITKTFAHKGQRFEIDILSPKRGKK
jgi:hypothetical protein